MEMFILYFVCLFVCFMYGLGEKGDEALSAIFVGIIPGLNMILAPVVLFFLVKRAVDSKFKCWLSHDYKLQYDSEAEKWKNGRRPMRISVGGFTTYKCTKCDGEYSEKWSAF